MTADLPNPPTTAVAGRLVIAALCLITAAALTACGPSYTPPNESHGSPGNAGIFNNRSVDDLIKAIQQSGLPAPNPRDVTASDCPPIGCVEKVDTDAVSVIKFPTTGKAELYAGSTQHCFQIADVVLTFAPDMSASRQQQYEQVITKEIQ